MEFLKNVKYNVCLFMAVSWKWNVLEKSVISQIMINMGPSILRPPIGLWKHGLILQVVL